MILMALCHSSLAAPPELTRIEPPGCQRGSESLVTIKGKWQKWPPQFWVDVPGVQIVAQEKEGTVKVIVPPETPPVPMRVRIFDPVGTKDYEGASAVRYFFLDALPVVSDQEPNDDWLKPQAIANRQVVYGVLNKRNDVDGYRITLQSGQRVFLNVDASRWLGSPLDACLQVVGARGVVVAQNLDARELDPQLEFVAPRDGDYVVRVFGFPATPDSTIGFAGGENYQYRLTVTTDGYVDGAFPSVSHITAIEPIYARGFGLPEPTIALKIFQPLHMQTSWGYAESFAGAVQLNRTEHQVIREGTEEAIQTVSLPCVVCGTIETNEDEDCYAFEAEKGTAWEFSLRSRSMHYPLDGVLVVEDAEGKVLNQVDDERQERDPRITWKAPATGRYRIKVKDLHGFGGADYHYQISARPAVPRYTIKVDGQNIKGKVGEPFEVKVNVERPDKGKDRLIVRAFADEELLEQAAVESSGEGESAKQVTLRLIASKPYQGPLHLSVSAEAAEGSISGLPYHQLDELWLSVGN